MINLNLKMDTVPVVKPDNATFLNASFCANTNTSANGMESPCENPASMVCGSCGLVQLLESCKTSPDNFEYCCKECQITNWRYHKKICKSELTKRNFIPGWIKQNRRPSWISDSGISSNFGVDQYLWGNMPALNMLKTEESDDICDINRDLDLLFAASGDVRNVVKTVVEGLSKKYKSRCTIIINDLNFMVVARNAILLFIALDLEPDEAVPVMMHVWYSALLAPGMIEILHQVALGRIVEVCEKIRDKPSTSLQAKTFYLKRGSLRLVLKKKQWNELKDYFTLPEGLTQEKAQAIRRSVMLAPERVDYLHRALCIQPPPIRVATVTFREDGILLPHGASRKEFDTPNPTFFHADRVWPMRDDAGPLEGWDYHEYIKFAPRAANDVMGAFFFFLKDLILRFCERLTDVDIHFQLFNSDARELPDLLNSEEPQFDRIELSNICDRGYVGPENILSLFSPLLKPKAVMLMLFLNAVGEVYHYEDTDGQRLIEGRALMQKFIPLTPTTVRAIMADGMNSMSSPEMIRVSSCYTMFGDFDRAFGVFLNNVQKLKLAKRYGVKIREKNCIIKPWPLRVTEETTKEEFELLCATTHLGSERYMEFEKYDRRI